MTIDLSLQVIESLPVRFWTGFKYFVQHYCKDKFTCPLMILWTLSLVGVIICFLLPDKNAPITIQSKLPTNSTAPV